MTDSNGGFGMEEEMDVKGMLFELMETAGPPGHEQRVAHKLKNLFLRYTDEVYTDAMGSLIARIKGEGEGERPRILIAAHMDEIALLVTKIEAGGFLRVTNLGGVDARTLLAQEVIVHTKKGDLRGIVGSKPPHLTQAEERKKSIPLENLFIDLALPEDEVRATVEIGDCVTVYRRPMELQNGFIAGKSLDNRASLAALFVCLQEMRRLRVHADVYMVATVQEELGLRGAGTAAFRLNPDLAVAVDVTFGKLPGQAPDQSMELGGGPAICFGPNIHRNIHRRFLDLARANRIPHQIELTQASTGTDAWAMQVTRQGIPTGLVSIPLRYMHTSVETVLFTDMEATGQLLAHFVASVDRSFVEGLRCYLKN
jgi:putative aminopeptidase FrvX